MEIQVVLVLCSTSLAMLGCEERPLGTCDPSSCTGCCGGEECQSGWGDRHCGAGGEHCVDCTTSGLVCTPSRTCGPYCGPETCAGCCDAFGACQNGDSEQACGQPGEPCED